MELLKTRHHSSQALDLLYKYCDEFWLLIDLSLESYYLKTYNALFSEHFYGLTRSFKSNQRHPILRSLLFSVILPYVKRKLDRVFESLRESVADGVPTSKILEFSRLYFVRVYPYIHMIYEGLHLFLAIAYTLGRSSYHQLSTQLAGLTLTQITTEAQSQFQERELKSRNSAQILPKIIRSFAQTLTFGLETGSFILQFFNHWQSRTEHIQMGPTSDIPDPPEIDPEISKTTCPICHGPRRTETLLSISGYVFCYVCVVKYLRQHGKCPITNFPANEDSLIRLYSQESS
eukprot:TCALIF_10333-PA protein Name:"Similar to Pex12 Peroxisome assembly protein 12 (Mus musculus)" AED:0.36 eAED:0.36 QI:0/0/0/0.66/1/1/3/0/288